MQRCRRRSCAVLPRRLPPGPGLCCAPFLSNQAPPWLKLAFGPPSPFPLPAPPAWLRVLVSGARARNPQVFTDWSRPLASAGQHEPPACTLAQLWRLVGVRHDTKNTGSLTSPGRRICNKRGGKGGMTGEGLNTGNGGNLHSSGRSAPRDMHTHHRVRKRGPGRRLVAWGTI